jgi:hypothetical protein
LCLWSLQTVAIGRVVATYTTEANTEPANRWVHRTPSTIILKDKIVPEENSIISSKYREKRTKTSKALGGQARGSVPSCIGYHVWMVDKNNLVVLFWTNHAIQGARSPRDVWLMMAVLINVITLGLGVLRTGKSNFMPDPLCAFTVCHFAGRNQTKWVNYWVPS